MAVGASPNKVASLISEAHARRRLVGGLEVVEVVESEASLEAAATVSPEEEKEPEAKASAVRQAHLFEGKKGQVVKIKYFIPHFIPISYPISYPPGCEGLWGYVPTCRPPWLAPHGRASPPACPSSSNPLESP